MFLYTLKQTNKQKITLSIIHIETSINYITDNNNIDKWLNTITKCNGKSM